MADNIVINPGSGGPTVASDDIGGVQYPRGKITLGDNNTDDGDVSKNNPLPSITKVVNNANFDLSVLVLDIRTNTTGYVTGPKILYSVFLENKNAGSRYFLLKNQSTDFSPGQGPDLIVAVPANSIVSVGPNFFGPNGMRFATGLSWGWSSVPNNYNPATAADHVTQVRGI